MLERNQNFGGAARVYQLGALGVEASLHQIDGLDAEDPKASILRSLGLDRDIPFVDVGDLHEVRSPRLGEPFVLSRGFDAALAATKRRFPHQTKGLDAYFDRIRAIRRAVSTVSQHEDDRGWWLWNAPIRRCAKADILRSFKPLATLMNNQSERANFCRSGCE